MHDTTPRVHLIAEPRLRWGEIEEYLASVDGSVWAERLKYRTHSVNPDKGPEVHQAEALIEFAGRGCYRSWKPGLNANVKKVREDTVEYLTNVLKSRHGSVLEHAQFTFVFQDVSRVFTHELVRHRAGVAISQESLRFVRLTDLGFRIPPILFEGVEGRETAGDSAEADYRMDLIVDIVERLEEFQRTMADRFGLDDEGVPFHYKKEVTSALRRLAPLGLSTMMTWSANVRTLRWVIQERTRDGAEEEIRLVFDQVARKMLSVCPILFGDFHPIEVAGTHIPCWVPTYEKV